MLGVPFHHQGRSDAGVDCIGLVMVAANRAGQQIENVTGYPMVPRNGLFMRHLLQHCDAVDADSVMPGDICMFAFDSEPQHIAIVTNTSPEIRIIHSYAQVGAVVETGIGGIWQRRLRGFYRVRGIES